MNHLILLVKEISLADMLGYVSSDSVVTNLFREICRIIPVTPDEAITISTKVSKVFEACPPSEDQLGPILLHIKERLKSQITNNLNKTRAEGFK